MVNILDHPNVCMLNGVAEKLDHLLPEVVFVGGAVVSLLLSDKAAPPVRYTVDVDCIVNVATTSKYYKLEKDLRKLGFKQSILLDDHICRWQVDEYLVDIIPIEENVIGFSNRWYHSAIKQPLTIQLDKDLSVNIIDAPHFLATKFEAFKDRGNDDYIMSHDIEDILAIIDGRDSLLAEITKTNNELREYLQDRVSKLLASNNFRQALPGHLNYDSGASGRANIVLQRLNTIVKHV